MVWKTFMFFCTVKIIKKIFMFLCRANSSIIAISILSALKGPCSVGATVEGSGLSSNPCFYWFVYNMDFKLLANRRNFKLGPNSVRADTIMHSGGNPYGTLFHCWSESLTSYKERIQAESVNSQGFMINSSGSENLLIFINPSQYRSKLNKM